MAKGRRHWKNGKFIKVHVFEKNDTLSNPR
jgi:hypothetical protein